MNNNTLLQVRSALKTAGISQVLQKLIELNYFEVPASLSHHQNYIGGLAEHSVEVMNNLFRFNANEKLGLSDTSIILIGLFHDLCKVDEYIIDKDKLRRNNFPKYGEGHGDKSVRMITSELGITLNEEEIACITWHMGAYIKESLWEDLNKAIEQYPSILWTHIADMYSANSL